MVLKSCPPNLHLTADRYAGRRGDSAQDLGFWRSDIDPGNTRFSENPSESSRLWTKSEENEKHEAGGAFLRNYPLTEWVRFVLGLAGEKSSCIARSGKCDTPERASQRPMYAGIAMDKFNYRPRELHYGLARTILKNDCSWSSASSHLASKDGPVRINGRWARVKAAIEALALEGHTSMSRAQFEEICGRRRSPSQISTRCCLDCSPVWNGVPRS